MEESDSEKNIPIGVKIISILYYIGAVIIALFGIVLIVSGGVYGLSMSRLIPFIETDTGGILIFLAITLIALGVTEFLIGRGLSKGRSWARIVVLIFGIIGILSSIMPIIQADFSAIVDLAIQGAVVGYLLFNKEAKEAFD